MNHLFIHMYLIVHTPYILHGLNFHVFFVYIMNRWVVNLILFSPLSLRRCTTTSSTPLAMKAKTSSRSTSNQGRCSRRWCSTGRSKERTLWRWRPVMGPPLPGPTVTENRTQVRWTLFILFYRHYYFLACELWNF